MSTKTLPPPAGHNLPAERDIIADLIADQVKAASAWMNEVQDITTQEQADRAADFKRQAAALEKRADTQRRKEKIPHDEAGKAVQKFWEPHLSAIERAKKAVDLKLTSFLIAQQRRIEAEKEKARKEAEEAQRIAAREADRAAELEAKAMRGELAGTGINTMAQLEHAEQARLEAEDAVKRAAAIEAKKAGAGGSSTAGGVRRTTGLRTREFVVFDVAEKNEAHVLKCLLTHGAKLITALAAAGELQGIAAEIHSAANRVFRKTGVAPVGFRIEEDVKAQ